MSWLQFISSLIASLAWPIAAVAIVCILRTQLAALFKRIAEITLPGGYKVVLREALNESQAAINTLPVRAGQSSNLSQLLDDISLLSQVLIAYDVLEESALDVRDIIGKPNLKKPEAVIAELFRQNLVSSAFETAYLNLKKARNAALHLGEVSAQEAIEFVGQAETLRQYLDTLKKQKAQK
jgi:hypothetical protein